MGAGVLPGASRACAPVQCVRQNQMTDTEWEENNK